MLGEQPTPIRSRGEWQNKFESRSAYRRLLEEVFTGIHDMLTDDATIYIRTDARRFTLETTLEVLSQTYPTKQLQVIPRPIGRKTQTALYGDKSDKPGEMDIILEP